MVKLDLDASAAAVAGPAPTGSAKNSKLQDAAQQFEAMMIGEMMKCARQSSDSGWLGSSGDDSTTDQAVEMAESHFAKALAMSGGFGLASVIARSVDQEAASRAHSPAALPPAADVSETKAP